MPLKKEGIQGVIEEVVDSRAGEDTGVNLEELRWPELEQFEHQNKWQYWIIIYRIKYKIIVT